MKILIVLLALSLTGCAALQRAKNALQRATNKDGLSTEERKERVRQQREEESERIRIEQEEIHAKIATLKEGVSQDEFVKAWGRPDEMRRDADQSVIYWYQAQPIYVFFLGNRVAGWKLDREEIERRARFEREREVASEIRQIRIEQAEENYRQSWRDLGNTFQNISNQNQMDQIQRNQRQLEWQQRNNDGRSHVNPF